VKKSPVGKVDPETGEVFEDLENADDEVRRPVVVTDEMRKEDFLICLGLITKKALSELQNKKTVRKGERPQILTFRMRRSKPSGLTS